jgi:hypothetical protein
MAGTGKRASGLREALPAALAPYLARQRGLMAGGRPR